MGKLTGAKIKEARTGAKLTQEQLARELDNITAADISKAERGEKELSQSVLKQIAKITGVTQASLLNAEKEPAPAAAKKPAAKTSSAKASGKTSSKASDDFKLTATEKTLVELYRKANSDTKKNVMSILKGEKSEMQQVINSLLGDALGKFLK